MRNFEDNKGESNLVEALTVRISVPEVTIEQDKHNRNGSRRENVQNQQQ